MPNINHSTTTIEKRKLRVRKHMTGTAVRPRVTVSRSNKHIVVQVIDDILGKTIAAASDVKVKAAGTKTQRAVAVTKQVVAQMKKQNLTAVVFDRGEYKYHGRVKAVAETLRSEGVEV